MTTQIERSELGPGPDFGVGLVVGATKEERQMRINFRNQLVMNLNNAVAAFGDWGDLEYFYATELDILNIDHECWKMDQPNKEKGNDNR